MLPDLAAGGGAAAAAGDGAGDGGVGCLWIHLRNS